VQEVDVESRKSREEFMQKLKEEWKLLWRERFDDRVRAEGVAIRNYPMVLMGRGFVIFASRDAKAPSFSEVVDFWASQGLVYAPDPAVGGWGKFVRNFIIRRSERRKLVEPAKSSNESCRKQRLKKGGRGWLHIE
jgi:hypothetical protein